MATHSDRNRQARDKQRARRDQAYEDYSKERDLLIDLERANYDGYEKAILTLSAAFLAFSVSFLALLKNRVTPAPPAVPIPIFATRILFYSWISFGSSVFLTVLNFLPAAIGMRAALVDAENRYEKKETYFAGPWTTFTMFLSVLAGIAFVVGLVLLIGFCTLNLPIL